MRQEQEPIPKAEIDQDPSIQFGTKAREQIDNLPLAEQRALAEGFSILFAEVLGTFVLAHNTPVEHLSRRQKELLRLLANPRTVVAIRGHSVKIEVVVSPTYSWIVHCVGPKGSAATSRKIRVSRRYPRSASAD